MPGESIGFGITFANAANDDVDLIVRKHAACALGECGHGRAGNTFGDDFAKRRVVGDGEIYGIAERERRATFGFGAVAAGAILVRRAGRNR